eukprot:Skav236285  [mRNA]  locus=scaffold2529:45650:46787:+ [translate_table: standard]
MFDRTHVAVTPKYASDWVRSVAWSPELQLLAAGCDDAKDFGLVKTLEEASNRISAVAFLGRLMAAGGTDCKGQSLESRCEDFQLVQTLKQSSEAILTIAPSGNHFAAGGYDKKIRICQAMEDFCVRSWQQLEHWVQLAIGKHHGDDDAFLHAAISRQALQEILLTHGSQ